MSTIPNFATTPLYAESKDNGPSASVKASDKALKLKYFDNPNQESIQHIDCIAKLVNPETIIIKQVPESSPEYECMEEFANSFFELNTFYGRPFKIHRIFCPEISGGYWENNPVAAYTNSLILNDKVFVPIMNSSWDDEALEAYELAMPGYEVLGFTGSWESTDALHCRTKGIPDLQMLQIFHNPIDNQTDSQNSFFF